MYMTLKLYEYKLATVAVERSASRQRFFWSQVVIGLDQPMLAGRGYRRRDEAISNEHIMLICEASSSRSAEGTSNNT